VGRGRRSGRRAPPEPSREGLERSLAFKRWARGRCFRCLERGHQVSACRDPFRCIRCRRPGHRERFCRVRSPVARDRSPVTCAPRQRSRSPPVQPCPSLARSWVEVVGHSSLCVSVLPKSQSGCCKDSNVCTSLVSALESQLALLRTELLQEVELLRTELCDALAKFEVASVVPLLPELQVGSIDEDAECCFGDFSPRALHVTPLVRGNAVITEVVALVLQIMPELQELCGESSMVLPMELSALESLVVAMPPSLPPSEPYQSPAIPGCGDLVGSVNASSMAIVHVASLSGEVDEIGALAPNSEALSCDQLETPESIVPVVPVTDDVEAVGALAPDPSEPNQSLASVERGGSDVAITHSHVT
uniref:CCHC-type domain-containing protein n=1 Tax=Triticum urartu TaxID=4572 RepID=A0A8R7QJN0_TRIUA